MNALLTLSRAIDRLTERIGRLVYWLVLAVVLISAANAIVRKVFNYSSNAFLEIQWYLFSVIFLFGAGYTLLRNEHVRIDIISGRLSARAQNWIDVVRHRASSCCRWRSSSCGCPGRCSSTPSRATKFRRTPGGLIIWPARLMVPIGFFLLIVQGVSELIKRIAFLRGLIPDPLRKARTASPPRRSWPRKFALQRGVETTHRGDPMTAWLIANIAPLMFVALIDHAADRLPGRVLARPPSASCSA